jgi:hypothetical protein
MKRVLLHFSQKQLLIIVPLPKSNINSQCKVHTRNNDVQNKTNVLPRRLHNGYISDKNPYLSVLFIDIDDLLSHELHSLSFSHIELCFLSTTFVSLFLYDMNFEYNIRLPFTLELFKLLTHTSLNTYTILLITKWLIRDINAFLLNLKNQLQRKSLWPVKKWMNRLKLNQSNLMVQP